MNRLLVNDDYLTLLIEPNLKSGRLILSQTQTNSLTIIDI